MSNTTQESKQNFCVSIFDKNSCQNQIFCINCEKKVVFLDFKSSNNNIILSKNVQTNLHINHKNFMNVMEEILCLCKQHNNLKSH